MAAYAPIGALITDVYHALQPHILNFLQRF